MLLTNLGEASAIVSTPMVIAISSFFHLKAPLFACKPYHLNLSLIPSLLNVVVVHPLILFMLLFIYCQKLFNIDVCNIKVWFIVVVVVAKILCSNL